MISIIDYGAGNLKSVSKALERLDLDSAVTSSFEDINNSKAMILPGVGSFGDCMKSLRSKGLDRCIIENVNKGKYLLGICLGLQLLYENSYEDGIWKGLGLLKGEIIRFDSTNKVPHMGWNNLIKGKDDFLSQNINEEEYVYFVHSYYAKPENAKDVVFWTEYGVKVPAVVRRNNIMGMQFHPEKSGPTGLKLLKNFGEMIR